MDISFCKLRTKDVINACDGRNLGNITDIIIDSCCGRILGLVVPNCKNFFSIFRTNNEIFIPYNRICKIGKDIILVDIIIQQNYDSCDRINCHTQQQNQNTQSNRINLNSILNNTKS